jgi:hypothetical protein
VATCAAVVCRRREPTNEPGVFGSGLTLDPVLYVGCRVSCSCEPGVVRVKAAVEVALFG